MGGEKEDNTVYWLTPVRSDEFQTADYIIQRLVGQELMFAFSARGTVKSTLKVGDWICFYASAKGVVAHAKVISRPERQPHPKIEHSRYPWIVRLKQSWLYMNNPIVIDASLRNNLDAFRRERSYGRWSWFVQQTRRISGHDFKILTRQEDP
jgi:hypothetical protein